MFKSGFTLVELIMVIVIIGILAAVAIPRFMDLSSQAEIAATRGSLGAIRSAIAIEYARSATGGGAAAFPSTISTAYFANGQIPPNELNDATATVATASVPGGTATNAAGWWYISASGRVGAFSDGTQDTSTW